MNRKPRLRPVKTFISAPRIRRRVDALAAQISRDYAGRQPLLVGVLKGCLLFLPDLLRGLKVPCTVDLMAVSSYRGDKSSGAVRLVLDLRESPAGRDVILVEDIVDTGLTLDYLKKSLAARGVRSLRVCALLDKPSCRRAPVEADYIGFSIPDRFVVGYGMDHDEHYRGLPYIGTLQKERS